MKLTVRQKKALQEVGQISAHWATLGLSRLLKRRIRIRVPYAGLLPIREVPELLGGASSRVAAVYFLVTGTVSGSLLLLYPLKQAVRLTDLVLHRRRRSTPVLDELAQSALKEVGNITTGAYLTALSEVGRIRLMHSIPSLAMDMLQAALDGVLIRSSQKADQVVALGTEFEVERERIPGHLFFVPDPEGLKKFFKLLDT